jgi:hypothetical protein
LKRGAGENDFVLQMLLLLTLLSAIVQSVAAAGDLSRSANPSTAESAFVFGPGIQLRQITFPELAFCSHLSGSYFDMHAEIDVPGVTQGPKSVAKLSDSQVIRLIDRLAKEYFRSLAGEPLEHVQGGPVPKEPGVVSKQTAKRYACYMVADGNNPAVSIVTNGRKWLRYVDGQRYFPNVGFKPFTQIDAEQDAHLMWIQSQQTPIQPPDTKPPVTALGPIDRAVPGSSRDTQFHRLAYFLMVHKDFDRVCGLIKALADRYAVILVHVDAKSPALKQQLQAFLRSRKEYRFSRVKIMRKSFNGLWAHSSLAMIELAGFFELLDMDSSWEYVSITAADIIIQICNQHEWRGLSVTQERSGLPNAEKEWRSVVDQAHGWIRNKFPHAESIACFG